MIHPTTSRCYWPITYSLKTSRSTRRSASWPWCWPPADWGCAWHATRNVYDHEGPWAAVGVGDGQRFGQSYEGATSVREGRIWVRHMQRYTCISTPFAITLSKNIKITLVVSRWHYESCFTVFILPLGMSSLNNVLVHKSEQPTTRCIAIFNKYCYYINMGVLWQIDLTKSLLLICQNTTMLVYGTCIGIYYVNVQKHIAPLAICSDPPLGRDKSLGALAFVRRKAANSQSLCKMFKSFSSVGMDLKNCGFPMWRNHSKYEQMFTFHWRVKFFLITRINKVINIIVSSQNHIANVLTFIPAA